MTTQLLWTDPVQRTWQIWSFAFAFAVRYFASRLRFTYGRGGMTEAAVSARRIKLAAWLREGLVRLGPTFIKIGQYPSCTSYVTNVFDVCCDRC